MRRSKHNLAALTALAALTGCSSPPADPRVPDYDDIQRIFDQSCSGTTCHQAAEGATLASIDLSPGASYERLVGQPSAAAPPRLLVAPGRPADSYLLCTIDPACGDRVGAPMPPAGALSPATVEAVRRWIAGGAPADATPPPPVDAAVDDLPRFDGISTATALGEHELELHWNPAFDRTPPARLRYRVYLGTAAGAEDFTVPVATVTGVTSTVVGGLAAGGHYWVVVRAVDELGQEDVNFRERAVDTLDLTPPGFGGVAALTEPTPGTLRVGWAPGDDNATPAAQLGYRVFVATTAGGQDFAHPTATVTGATSVDVTGLAPATTYHVVVRAFDRAGNQDANVLERSLTTVDTVAPTFAGVTSATGAPSAVVLGWAPASDDTTAAGALVYLVYRSTTAGGQDLSTPTYVTPPGVTSFSAGGLAPSTTYHFVVRARDGAGNIDGNTGQRSATTPAAADTTPPVFAGVTGATALGASSIRLTWSAGSDNVTAPANLAYLIYRATTPGGQTFGSATYLTAPGATSFVATGLAPSTTYHFVVRVFDRAGNVDANVVEVSATTTGDTTPPLFAGISGAATASSSSIALAWAPAADDITPAAALVYDVYRSTAAGGQSFAAPSYTTAPGATGLVATGLVPATTYHFVVRARDAAGNADSNTVERSAVTGADDVPPVFAGASGAAATGTPGELQVSWAAAADQVTPAAQLSYLVFAATTSGGQAFFAPTAQSAPGATSITLTGLQAGTPYFVVVRARDAAGNTDTNTVQVSATTTPDVTAPTFAGAVSAAPVNPSRVRLTWAAAQDDATPTARLVYQVYAATTPGGQSYAAPIATSPAGATELVVGGLSATTTYHFVVRARDDSGNLDANTVERSATTPAHTVSFAGAVQPILSASCATVDCHGEPVPAGGIDLSTAHLSYVGLVGFPASQCVAALRVAPGSAADSYLMTKLIGAGPCAGASLMPPSGALPAAQLALIATWIDEGAADN